VGKTNDLYLNVFRLSDVHVVLGIDPKLKNLDNACKKAFFNKNPIKQRKIAYIFVT